MRQEQAEKLLYDAIGGAGDIEDFIMGCVNVPDGMVLDGEELKDKLTKKFMSVDVADYLDSEEIIELCAEQREKEDVIKIEIESVKAALQAMGAAPTGRHAYNDGYTLTKWSFGNKYLEVWTDTVRHPIVKDENGIDITDAILGRSE